MVTSFRPGTNAGQRDEADKYRPIYTSKIILNLFSKMIKMPLIKAKKIYKS